MPTTTSIEVVQYCVALMAGLIMLAGSADRFISGAVSVARRLGMSPMLIGLTVVACGTSAPEILVSATAALANVNELAVGNALGSNIANIGLVLGITAIVSPLTIQPMVLKRELPVLMVATAVVWPLLLDGYLGRMDGFVLITGLLLAITLLSRVHLRTPELQRDVVSAPDTPLAAGLFWLVFSLTLLVFSSQLLVWGASGIARELGVSDLVIGLTIVAIGTSLPELAASVASVMKGHSDIALGNVLGSNLFNLLAVLAMPALINPGELGANAIYRDYGVMVLMTTFLAVLVYGFRQRGKMVRSEGVILSACYAFYLLWLYLDASGAT